MGTDLQTINIINKLWYLVKGEIPGDKIEHLDYFTILAVGITLLRYPGMAQQFIDEAWTKAEVGP